MPHMNDRDIFSDFLKDAKFKSQAYHMATVESANENIRETCLRFMTDELQSHRAIFHTMSQRGWYPVEPDRTQPAHLQAGGGYTPSPQGPGAFHQDPGAGDYRAFRRDDQKSQQPHAPGFDRQNPRFRE